MPPLFLLAALFLSQSLFLQAQAGGWGTGGNDNELTQIPCSARSVNQCDDAGAVDSQGISEPVAAGGEAVEPTSGD